MPHAPDASRIRIFLESFLPPRFNEMFQTFHMKAYVFDDTVILSGANLSTYCIEDIPASMRSSRDLHRYDDFVEVILCFSCNNVRVLVTLSLGNAPWTPETKKDV